MGEGFLRISATTGEGFLAVADANVQIFDEQGNLLFETTTNSGGITGDFGIAAPDAALTLDSTYGRPAYSTVNVIVSAPGFITEHINGVGIVDTQYATLPVILKPLAQGQASGDNYTDIPEIGLLIPMGDNQPGPTGDIPAGRVLANILVPDFITVHLGAPTNAAARNVRVPFIEYIKNVASSEIYSTWPTASLTANIHAIVSFALNRVYTEWYRARGYNFDVTNNTQFDQYFRENGPIYDSISRIVDVYFNTYIRRVGFSNPFFSIYCAGSTNLNVRCNHGGMSQWGTVTLANQGRTPIQILRQFYGDVELSTSTNIGGITSSYPGTPLTIGSTGPNVQRIQNFLNRIRVNFPLIPRIDNPNGVFDQQTANAVRVFQSINGLAQDGIVGPATWNRISRIYVGVTRLAELDAEGHRITIPANPPNAVLSQGSRGQNVLLLQFMLNVISAYYPEIPSVIQDSLFETQTRNAVNEFQRRFGIAPDGVVGPITWARLFEVYRGIDQNVSIPPVAPPPISTLPPYPGVLIRRGSTGANVRIIQEYLNVIRTMYPNIPQLAVDGNFGPLTEAAVIAFQRQFLLTPDGIVGPITWNRIMEQYAIAIGTPPPPKPPGNYFEYTVLPGDTLFSIALKFGTTVEEIMRENNLTSDVIFPGQILQIPYEGPEPPIPPEYIEHVVVAGDTLWALAQRYGTTVDAIKALNGLTGDLLMIGQVLKIPTGATPPPPPPPPEYFEYTVVAGDSLWLLAQRFNTTVEAIMQLNGLTSTLLSIGQVLRIPGRGTTPPPPPPPPPPPIGKTVVLDPGHGGSDSGAVNGSRLEKNDNLRLALAVRDLLQARGINTIMTRSTDVFIPLEERSNISNRNNADLFVSFHRDSSTNTAARGVANFIHTSAPSRTAGYAFEVLDNIVDVGAFPNRGVQRANFAVLRNTIAPAMLLEMGFISNTADNQAFDQNLNANANAIANGIVDALTKGPTNFNLYTVVAGDTLSAIANRFGTTQQAIMALNKMPNSNLLTGQVLRIP